VLSRIWEQQGRSRRCSIRTVDLGRVSELQPDCGESQTYSTELTELVRKIEKGDELTPHLSRAVDTAFVSTQERAALKPHQRDQDRDRMLADWGIHHLHLSSMLEGDGFNQRDNPCPVRRVSAR
jgi:hypothetical protein